MLTGVLNKKFFRTGGNHFDDAKSVAKVSNHAYYTFWYVLPTLPMFLVFPKLLERFGFWPSLGISAVGTTALFLGYAIVMRKFGIELLP